MGVKFPEKKRYVTYEWPQWTVTDEDRKNKTQKRERERDGERYRER